VFSRFSQTEFAIALPNTDVHGAMNTAVKIKLLLDHDENFDHTISMGISSLGPKKDDYDSLLARVQEQLSLARQKKNSIEMDA
jgi:PleD family two-component response regulator